jgi:hypothetical protein
MDCCSQYRFTACRSCCFQAYNGRFHLLSATCQAIHYLHAFYFFQRHEHLSCIEKFTPTHSITQISITSLLPFNEFIIGQNDITDKFFALLSSGLYSEHLYYSIEQTIQNFNNIKYFEDYTQEELNFFLSSAVTQDQAQFRIDIRFSDGTVLSETTPIIHIIH